MPKKENPAPFTVVTRRYIGSIHQIHGDVSLVGITCPRCGNSLRMDNKPEGTVMCNKEFRIPSGHELSKCNTTFIMNSDGVIIYQFAESKDKVV